MDADSQQNRSYLGSGFIDLPFLPILSCTDMAGRHIHPTKFFSTRAVEHLAEVANLLSSRNPGK